MRRTNMRPGTWKVADNLGVIIEYVDDPGYTPNDSGNDDNGGGGSDNSISPGEHW